MPISQLARRRFLQLTGATLTSCFLPRAARALQQTNEELVIRQKSPFNAEARLDKLAEQWTTPLENMFVRSSAKKLPKIDAATYRLRIEGLVDKRLELSLAQIRAAGRARKQHVALTCAGNRRAEHSAIKPVGGVQWEAGAIGNCEWEGIALGDLLAAAGVQSKAKHIWFEGLDEVEEGDRKIAFGGSIPLQKMAAKEFPVLLATGMNGAPLTQQHGFPLRAIVPGYIGARSVKWLGKIVVSDRPSPNYFLAQTYKVVKTNDPDEMAQAEPIYEYLLNSAICTPTSDAKLTAGAVLLTGYALPPGKPTATISQVEIAVDDGKWERAQLEKEDQPFCWALWRHTVQLSPGKHTLRVRATDNHDERQPEQAAWNAKGYLYNGWHTVEVEVT